MDTETEKEVKQIIKEDTTLEKIKNNRTSPTIRKMEAIMKLIAKQEIEPRINQNGETYLKRIQGRKISFIIDEELYQKLQAKLLEVPLTMDQLGSILIQYWINTKDYRQKRGR